MSPLAMYRSAPSCGYTLRQLSLITEMTLSPHRISSGPSGFGILRYLDLAHSRVAERNWRCRNRFRSRTPWAWPRTGARICQSSILVAAPGCSFLARSAAALLSYRSRPVAHPGGRATRTRSPSPSRARSRRDRQRDREEREARNRARSRSPMKDRPVPSGSVPALHTREPTHPSSRGYGSRSPTLRPSPLSLSKLDGQRITAAPRRLPPCSLSPTRVVARAPPGACITTDGGAELGSPRARVRRRPAVRPSRVRTLAHRANPRVRCGARAARSGRSQCRHCDRPTPARARGKAIVALLAHRDRVRRRAIVRLLQSA